MFCVIDTIIQSWDTMVVLHVSRPSTFVFDELAGYFIQLLLWSLIGFHASDLIQCDLI